MQKKPTGKFIPLAGIISFFVIAISWTLHAKSANKQAATASPIVKTMQVKEAENKATLKISGFVRGTNRADIVPMASGRITKIFKREGDYIKKGELIATIDPQQADAQTSAAGAGVNALEKTLNDSERYYNQLVDQAQAARDEAKKSGGSLSNADEAVKSAKRARDLQIQSMRDQLVSAQGSLGIAQAGRNNFNVTSPFSGTITNIYTREGGFANFSAPLFSVSSSNTLELETYVTSTEGRSVSVGGVATFLTSAGAPFAGTIIAVSPGADTQTLKTLVRIKINDETNIVRLGDFVHGEIMIPRTGNAVSIPRSAIVSNGGDAIVFTIDENNIAKEQLIKINGEQNGQVDVADGLKIGQKIAVQGQQFLINGIKVTSYDAR